jgi:hypothetical protein
MRTRRQTHTKPAPTADKAGRAAVSRAAVAQPQPEPIEGRLAVVTDPTDTPGDVIPALARLLRQLRDRAKAEAGGSPN